MVICVGNFDLETESFASDLITKLPKMHLTHQTRLSLSQKTFILTSLVKHIFLTFLFFFSSSLFLPSPSPYSLFGGHRGDSV